MQIGTKAAVEAANAANISAGWTREIASSGSQSANAAVAGAEAATKAAIAAEGTLKAMEATAERQLRAYILMQKAQVFNIGVGMIPTAKITIVNSGQTPAKNFIQSSVMGFDHFPARLAVPTQKEENPSAHPLAPSAEIYACPGLRNPLIKEQIEGMINGTLALYVVGRIDYEDAFGKKRWTNYRLFCGGPIGIDSGAMSAYHEGNDYN